MRVRSSQHCYELIHPNVVFVRMSCPDASPSTSVGECDGTLVTDRQPEAT